MRYHDKPCREIHHDVAGSFRKNNSHRRAYLIKEFLLLEAFRNPWGEKIRTKTWFYCKKYKHYYGGLSMTEPLYFSLLFHVIYFERRLIVLNSSLIKPDTKWKFYSHWKLTTHFLPAMPRKYFSVRSHISCSSVDMWKKYFECMYLFIKVILLKLKMYHKKDVSLVVLISTNIKYFTSEDFFFINLS